MHLHYLILGKSQLENFYFSYSKKLSALKYKEPISDTDGNKIETEDKDGGRIERRIAHIEGRKKGKSV